MSLTFTTGEIPDAYKDEDQTPPTSAPAGTVDYDPDYPGSTPDAPYGYKPDGTPYKRRPSGSKPKSNGVSSGTRGRASDSQARAAAAMLAQVNNLVCMSLTVAGMPMTASSIAEANGRFEAMALEALRTDPSLCKKILSAGATSGKTALFMAYGYLGMSAFPAARDEYKAAREAKRLEQEQEEY